MRSGEYDEGRNKHHDFSRRAKICLAIIVGDLYH